MDKLEKWTNILGVADMVFTLFKTIYTMADNAKANKELCKQLAQKASTLEGLVLKIKEGGPAQIPTTVYEPLMDLCSTLESAEDLMWKFSRKNAVVSFLKSSNIKEKFDNIDKRLTNSFLILSGALLIEQRDVLNKVHDTLTVRRKPQSRFAIPTFPTTPSPPSSIISSVSQPISRASTPVPKIISPNSQPISRASTPGWNIVSANSTPYPTGNTPFPGVYSPMPLPCPMTPMFLPAPTTLRFSNTIISAPGMTSPITIASPMAPMTFSAQTSSFVTSYVFNS